MVLTGSPLIYNDSNMKTRYVFEPWVGKAYAEGIGGKRVLILGESHYCASASEARPSLTQEVIADLLDPTSEHEAYKNTYTKCAKAVAGLALDSAEARACCYGRTAFYNYVQSPISGARVAPTAEEFEASAPAFASVLEELRPQCILVWGKRLYERLPRGGEALPDLHVSGKRYRRWCYRLRDNSPVQCLEMLHPSAAYSPEEWEAVIRIFIDQA